MLIFKGVSDRLSAVNLSYTWQHPGQVDVQKLKGADLQLGLESPTHLTVNSAVLDQESGRT